MRQTRTDTLCAPIGVVGRNRVNITPDPIGLAGGVNPHRYVVNDPVNLIDPKGLFGFTIGFEPIGSGFGFGAFAGIYGNFAHDSSQPLYQGWSSSVTITAGGGAAASVYGASAGVHFSGNNACNVKQLNRGFINAGRLGLGGVSVGGYQSPDRSVTGGSVTIGPTWGYIGAIGGGSYTWTLGGGDW